MTLRNTNRWPAVLLDREGKGGERASLLGKEWREVSWAWPGRMGQLQEKGEWAGGKGSKRGGGGMGWLSWLGKEKGK
jgi:hypothetical protein